MKRLLVLAFPVLTGAALATDFVWKSAVDGEISDPAMWDQGDASPAVTGDALIWGKDPNPYGNTPFTVSLSEDRSYGTIFPKAGQVTFDLGGHSLSVSSWEALTYRRWATDGIYAGTTISNGALTVSNTFRPCYPAPDHAGVVKVVGPNTVVTAGYFEFGGLDSTMTVDGGAKVKTGTARHDALFSGKGGRNTLTYTGSGTEYEMHGGLEIGNNGYTAGCEGTNALVIEKGAIFSANGFIRVGASGDGRNPSEIRVQDGGVMRSCAFLNIGTWASDSRMAVTGKDSFASITNGSIYVCDQQTTNCQLVVSDGAKFEFHTSEKSDTMITVNGYGGGRLIVEDGAVFEVHNHYSTPDGAPGPYQTVKIGNRKGLGSDAKVIVRNGAIWRVVGRSSTYIGCGDPGAELVISNATFDAGTTDSVLHIATGENYPFTEDTHATLRLQGDDAVARFFSIHLGYAPHIVLEPGENGFNQTPITLTKNVFYKEYEYVPESADEYPELVLDVTNWKPVGHGERTLIQTDRTSYRWHDGTNAMKRLVSNAKVVPQSRAQDFEVYLSEDLTLVKVKYHVRRGLVVSVR